MDARPAGEKIGGIVRQTSRMRWNVSEAAVGSLFLVAVRLGKADSLPVRGELPQAMVSQVMVRTRAAEAGEGTGALGLPARACRRGRKLRR